MPHQHLDARDLKCPLPVLKARKRLSAMASGEVLAVTATDPAAAADFAAFCDATGHHLVETRQEADQARTFLIRRR